jgi:flagellar assembly protein FliH
MSLSDIENDDFQPIDVKSLDKFEEELSAKTPETEPDLERFKMLFDPSELEGEEPVSFEALYSFAKQEEEEPFEPLIKGTDEPDIPSPPAGDVSGAEEVEQVPAEPEKTPEELGFEAGYQKGLAQGLAEGRAEGEAKGFEQGVEKGEAEGFEKGEAKGLETGHAQGLETGLEEGRQAGRAEVEGEAAQILTPLKESLETVEQLLERLVKRYEVQIIELVHKIAQKAVMAKVDTDDEVVKDTILDAVKSLVAPEEIELNVSTEDYEYVEMIKDEFFESVRSLKHVAVSSDPMISKGGCRIESSTATISTDPETKLAAVYDAIVKAGMS